MGTTKDLDPTDQAVAQVLADAVRDSGLSYRDLRAKTGLSINRIGKILRKESPPMTVGELRAIALQVGMTASQVIVSAERRVETAGDVSPMCIVAKAENGAVNGQSHVANIAKRWETEH